MKISLNWINEFVDLKGIAVEELVSRFSLSSAEIEGYEQRGHNISGVVVGEIKTCERVPNSNKLWKLTVDNGTYSGDGGFLPVICGAPNCRVGMKVALANIGAKLGTFEIEKAKLAGYDSHGMCCGSDELGISNDHSGIIELEPGIKNGTPIQEAIPEMVDTIIEIDNKSLTNRPDLWGHYGIAREFAVIFGKTFKKLEVTDLAKFDALPKVPVAIENKTDCLSYGAIRVDGVTRQQSPLGMQIRLFYCGINAHGFLVDLTNYVMLETAQPNHAFNADKVGKISVGNVNTPSSVFVTLKDQEVKITQDMLFIKSDGKPVALAGVIGGKNSEIDDSTKNCVFEFATFDGTCVRKTAASLGLRTDASARFEKSLDTNLNTTAAARTIKLIEKYDKAAKVVSSFSRVAANETKTLKLSIDKKYLERFCGITFNYKEVERNLKGLGFEPIITADKINITVPTWRATKDITCEADIIEEIVRITGYDKIQPIAPKVALNPIEQLPQAKLITRVKNLLADKHSCQEVHTYIWDDTKLNKQLGIETASALRIVNSCNKENDTVRSELSPSLLCQLARNRQSFDNIKIFEIGSVFAKTEQKHLGIVLYSKSKSGEQLYKEISNIVRDVFGDLGFTVKFNLSSASQKYLHPKNNAVIVMNSEQLTMNNSGFIGIVPDKSGIAVAEICLDGLGIGNSQKAARVSKYPKSVLDFTFDTDKVYGEVQSVFDKFKHKYNMGFKLKDIFEKDGNMSYTLAFTVGSFDRTLTSEEINEFVQSVIKHGRVAGFTIKE